MTTEKKDKPYREICWNDLDKWEYLLAPNVTVLWKGANSVIYRTTLLSYSKGNARLKFEDGNESSPCYIEQFVGIETADEIIDLFRQPIHRTKLPTEVTDAGSALFLICKKTESYVPSGDSLACELLHEIHELAYKGLEKHNARLRETLRTMQQQKG
jgi:hypothetical protein